MSIDIIHVKNGVEQRTCFHCGHTGADVHLYPSAFGDTPQCDIIRACFRRAVENKQREIEATARQMTAPGSVL